MPKEVKINNGKLSRQLIVPVSAELYEVLEDIALRKDEATSTAVRRLLLQKLEEDGEINVV